MRANRLRLEIERAPELVASARGVAPKFYLVALAANILVAALGLDVVLPHEADRVTHLNDQIRSLRW